MRRKQEDVHTHEVELPDGTVAMTGPPIGETHEDEEGEEAEAEASGEMLPAAVPEKRVKSVTAPEPDLVRAAMTARDPEKLPGRAKEIYDSMRSSYLRFVSHRKQSGGPTKAASGRPLEDYADRLAWHGVNLAYFAPAEAPAPAKRVATKSVSSVPGVVLEQDGKWFVPAIPHWRDAESHHEVVENRLIPGTDGVEIMVGSVQGRKNIIGVFVPFGVAGDGPNGMGAKQWVSRNWELVYRVGTAELDFAEDSARAPLFKFTARATNAKEKISYGVVYAPWEVDLQGQFATEREVAKMAHRFMVSREGAAKLMHRTLTTDAGEPVGQIVESWISKKRGDPAEPFGAWMMGIKWSDPVWSDVAADRIRGFSMGGDWTVVPIMEAA